MINYNQLRRLRVELEHRKNEKVAKWGCAFDWDEYDDLVDFKPQPVNVVSSNYITFIFVDSSEQVRWNDFHLDDEWDFINIFDTEAECIEFYNDLVWKLIKKCNDEINHIEKLKDRYKEQFINTDFLMEKLRRGE